MFFTKIRKILINKQIFALFINMLNFKKIIQEEVESFLNQQKLQKDILFLKDFNFVSFGNQEDGTKDWLFEKSWKDNALIIKISNKGNNWQVSIDYENRYSKEIGSDVTWTFVGSYEDFIDFIDNKLKNNPLINTKLLNNDLSNLEEREVLIGIKRVLKKGTDIDSIKEGNIDDLKKLLDLLRSMKQITTKEKLLNILMNSYGSYGAILMILNKVDTVDYYLDLQKMHNL